MFNVFYKATLRSLYREKIYALINISGLTIAITCCLIIGLYSRSELTYDSYHVKHREIFRVVNEFNMNGKIDSFAITSQSLGPLLVKDYPEIKDFVRLRSIGQDHLFRHKDKAFYWKSAFFADVNVFEIFTHHIIYGDPKTALLDPSSAAVSESFARMYFGDENPIGKIFNDDSSTYKITLVFADLPENSHLRWDVLLSYNSFAGSNNVEDLRQKLYGPTDFTYLLMPEKYDVRDFENISKSFYKHHMAKIGEAIKATWRCWLEPLTKIHFNSEVGYDMPKGNITYVYGIITVGIFLLLVSCINYINLATARATKRTKEVGIRKVLGSSRAHLILQFLSEAVLFSFIAMFFSMILVEVLLRLTHINGLLGKQLTLNFVHELDLPGYILFFTLVLGLISGIYPALFLSSISRLSALAGGGKSSKGNVRLRKILVFVQFIAAVTIIACTILMTCQIKYVSNKSLGFNKENKLIVKLQGEALIKKIPTIRQELLQNSNILGVATCSHVLGEGNTLTAGRIEDNNGVLGESAFNNILIDKEFIKVMGIEIIEGRDLSKKQQPDNNRDYIVNEAMVKKMGWKQPIGKKIIMIDLRPSMGQVVGVVKNFHYTSLHKKVEPLVLRRFNYNENIPARQRSRIRRNLILNIRGEDIVQTLKFIKGKFAEFDPTHPFKYEFMDNFLNELYFKEHRTLKLIGIFSGVCILISFMGMLSLSAFTIEQRTKEISIRKVLGASKWQIIRILIQNFMALVLGGSIIGSFLAYLTMEKWLTNFAYRINIDKYLWVFLLSCVLTVTIAFITIALQCLKVTRENPSDVLRWE